MATVAVCAVFVAGLVLAFATLLPRVYSQLQALGRDLPGHVETFEAWLAEHEGADPRLRDASDILVERADEVAIDAVKPGSRRRRGFFGSLAAVLFGLVVGFYLLLGGPRLAEQLPRWFPPSQPRALDALRA